MRKKVLWTLMLVGLLGLTVPSMAFCKTEGRMALLIGNGEYLHGGRLANPASDVRAMKTALEGLGFTVFKYENCTQKAMKEAMDNFGIKLKGQEVGLFFYAGHGVQVSGYNYLIPVDANLSNEKKVEYDCVRADRILAEMENAGTRTSIVILDACRDNPFERSWRRGKGGSGLAFMNAPSGSLIAYSTAPGKTALDGSTGNSPYTAALLDHIATPNITVLQMFQRVRSTVSVVSENKQIPWESTSLKGDFYFAALEKRPEPAKADKPALPSEERTSFDDILKARTEQKQAMETWAAWQSAREREYAQVQEIDEDTYLKPNQKAAAWDRFLSAVSSNNPFSDKDDAMRATAGDRARYWHLHKAGLVASKPPPSVPTPSAPAEIGRDGVYVAYANGIVKDTKTGLEWIAGPDRDTNWKEARAWVENLNVDGGRWRMPTMGELAGLYRKGAGSRNMTSLLKTSGWSVWSGEAEGSYFYRILSFGDGSGRLNTPITRGYYFRAFAVRSRSDG